MEALLASTILAIVAASAALPFASGVQNVNAAAELEQATALGEAMMEEVLARPFFEPTQSAPTPGPEPTETTRLAFNSIDDFNAFSETSGNLKTFQNGPVTDPSAQGFWRTVSVQYVRFPSLGQPLATDPSDPGESLIHIEVKVYHDSALLVTLDRLVARED